MSTINLSAKDIHRSWHVVDMADQVLGRVATDIAVKLMGKNKPYFVPHLDTGDFVVVINASKVRVTGKKAKQKIYFRHSGYPGGDTRESFESLIARRPEEVVRHAVWGMLPKTKLGKRMIKKLHVFAKDSHPFQKQVSGGAK